MSIAKIRVAYILTPITFGGAEKVSLNFLRTIDRKQFDVLLIILIRPWEKAPYFAKEIQKLGYEYETVPVAIKTGGDPLRVLRVGWRLFSLLRRESIDLVHTHGYFANICGLTAAKLLGLGSISTCHGFVINDKKMKVYNFLDLLSLRFCRKIIAVSEAMKTELICSGIKDSRIEVIPNAVEFSCEVDNCFSLRQDKRKALNIAQHEYVVGYLGRLSEEKGVSHLIEAFALLHDTSTSVKLLIVGEGRQKAELEAMVEDRGLKDDVVFTGFQTDTESWLSIFDVFVLPSLTEGTPMALLEAMALGIPVIATSVGGVPKVVMDGINGILLAPADPGLIKDKIELLKGDKCFSLRISKSGFNMIRDEYSIASWCRKIESQYLGLLS